ncbi:SAM-dependent methyltransferase [Planomonospora sp. ID82291]|uniref:SAM-dependent methyltransferase n=1 Tax=Planomonospora sp. ID82291 TaxID=2738136 RepID=UPI0018C43974|nr:SAM-dependent methyltransferase [Planomonospora sp. ID82291]MBG0818375.1 SAM-dependent methyltransferase [Planomonospora sp. ID82291]
MSTGESTPAAPAAIDHPPLMPYDPSIPNVARVYDFLLGGKNNFAVDRTAAARLTQLVPGLQRHALYNRMFLQRVVHDLALAGVRQFVDLGSGLPTQDNVHEVVHRVAPDARIVYIDIDQMAAVHARALLARHPDGLVRFVEADVREITDLLARPELAALDRSRPIAVTAVALFHFMPSTQPKQIVTALREWLPRGSYLAISHATPGTMSPQDVKTALAEYQRANLQLHLRSPQQVRDLFNGFQLQDDIAPVQLWRPEFADDAQAPEGGHFIGGLGWLKGDRP